MLRPTLLFVPTGMNKMTITRTKKTITHMHVVGWILVIRLWESHLSRHRARTTTPFTCLQGRLTEVNPRLGYINQPVLVLLPFTDTRSTILGVLNIFGELSLILPLTLLGTRTRPLSITTTTQRQLGFLSGRN